MKVAFFGGSFDPPHVGHVLAAAYALSTGFDQVLVCVVKSHAFGKQLTAFETRVAMARLAFAALPAAVVTDIEGSLPPPNYTLHTLQAIQAAHPDWQLRLLAGTDVAPDFDKWFGFEEIRRIAPPLLLGRPGHRATNVIDESADIVLPAVSSTEARENLSQHPRSPTAEVWLRTHLPRGVLTYIEHQRIYAAF